ncbi:hypothetical protein jhhlp_000948 [Lomentospora prolificans]|uniref:Uncharacterized protein n=1 Tax=Lomentospora prolificans TaxID=41688 RepID=A0A2N3NJY0_9PEZI|nr:hypothetical protein jhhlp_000948 [Lomentospora prolificans]
MTMKRKRSISEFSSSPTRPSSSCFTSPSGSINFAFNPFRGPSLPLPMPTMVTNPSHLNSRTLKRFRDSRPSEREIHQRTLCLLYSAQRQQSCFADPSSSAILPDVPATQENTNATNANANCAERTLHSFWALPPTPSSMTSTPSVTMSVVTSTSCDDCGVDLPVSDGSESMDVDGSGLAVADFACRPCGKKVCSHCSVTNLEEQRMCLQCAGRKVSVGSVGWTAVSGMLVG